jgi:DNA replication protein DnaC
MINATVTEADELLLEVFGAEHEIRMGTMEDTHCVYCNAWRDVNYDKVPYEPHKAECTRLKIEAYLKKAGLI